MHKNIGLHNILGEKCSNLWHDPLIVNESYFKHASLYVFLLEVRNPQSQAKKRTNEGNKNICGQLLIKPT